MAIGGVGEASTPQYIPPNPAQAKEPNAQSAEKVPPAAANDEAVKVSLSGGGNTASAPATYNAAGQTGPAGDSQPNAASQNSAPPPKVVTPTGGLEA